MRKFYALMMAIIVIATLAVTTACESPFGDRLCDVCGRCTNENCAKEKHSIKCICEKVKEGIPAYGDLEANQGFYLSIFGDPCQQTIEAYEMVKELGCNWVYLDPWNGTGLNSTGLAKALEVCEVVGLNALIMLGNSYDTTTENAVSFLDVAIEDYTKYPAFKGVYAFDEPSIDVMPWIAEDMERWENSKYKDYIYFVNTVMRIDAGNTKEEFMETYWDTILSKNDDNILIYDTYPLRSETQGDKVLPFIAQSTLNSLEYYAQLAKDKDSKFYVYLQTYCEKTGAARDLVSINDARFQIGMNLAFGVDGFACFTYVTMSQFGDSMVTPNNTKLAKYYYFQEVFEEIKNFENVYFAFDYQGTIAALGPNRGADRGYGEQPEEHFAQLKKSLTSHHRIDEIKTEYDLLVGTFEDKDGYDGFLITTYTDPYYMKDNNIEIDFNNASRALVYYNGKLLTNDELGNCYLLDDGVLKFDLEAGDYLFVIPVK